ncbi:TPA: hypothetical protein NHP85_006877, partial [Pseudomonas aeruginosa]|nr:hypothetical protein [Pseudomonas aeruginosa]
GSTDPRDLYDNAGNLDKFANGADPFYPDRLTQQRLSWRGMESRFQSSQESRAEDFNEAQIDRQQLFDQAQAQRDVEFNEFLLNSGYQFIGDYDADGPLTIERVNQVFSHGGEFWRAGPDLLLPYTTVNDWAVDEPKFVSVGDAYLRQEIAASSGAAMIGVSAVDSIQATVQDVVGGIIFRSMVIDVPGDFPETADAMDWLRTKTIVNGANVTIKIAEGVNPATRSTLLNHPQGIRVSIIGNQADKSLCQIVATDGSSFDAFIVSGGNEFGRIDGVTIKKATKSAGTGILSISGAALKCGPNVEVENFYYSFAARDGATMNADGVVSRNAGDVGIWAFNGAHVSAVGAYAYSAIDIGNDLGYGFQAEYGGTMECSFGFSTGCRKAGFAAINGGVMRAHNTNSISNSGSGYLSGAKGHVAVNGATANTNGTWGYEVIFDGTFSGPRGGTGNGQSLLTKPVAYFDNDVSQGGVRAITGTPLRVGSNGTDGVIIDVNGSVAFRCGTLAGSAGVNYGQVDSAPTGQAVQYKVRGSDTNIDLELAPKNAGQVRVQGSAWNTTHFCIGLYHLWVDASGRLRIKSSAPTSDTDGTVVGAQS